MNHMIKGLLGSAFAVASLGYASSAMACGSDSLQHAASLQRDGAGALLHLASEGSPGNHEIVGLWSFKMTAGGATADFGYQTWHSDGTELMNSGGRQPSTENFCMGVWRQVAPNRYHLNHVALSYDSNGVNANVVIKEDVTLDRSGMTFSGPFSLDVYDPKNHTLLQEVKGEVTAQRILAN